MDLFKDFFGTTGRSAPAAPGTWIVEPSGDERALAAATVPADNQGVDETAAVSVGSLENDTAAGKAVENAVGATQADNLPQPAVETGLSISADHSKDVSSDNLEINEADAQAKAACVPSVAALFRREEAKHDDDDSTEKKGGKGSSERKMARQAAKGDSGGSDGHWGNWKPRGESDRQAAAEAVESGNAWHGQDWDWDWRNYINVKDSTVRVELSGMNVSDKDLPSLFQHLETVLQRHLTTKGSKDKVLLNIDLSCNTTITDTGVTSHLAPFLEQWPACARLKLYKTSIGDKAIESLGPWISRGFAHELHLSDLKGHVSGDVVFNLLKHVTDGGNYPYWNADGHQCALWLRLEHNGIRNTDKILSRGKENHMALCVIEKNDLARTRPGVGDSKKGVKKMPAVHLVLFQMQEVREPKLKGAAPDESAWNNADDSAWRGEEAAWAAADSSWKATDPTWRNESAWAAGTDQSWNDDSSWNAAAAPEWQIKGGKNNRWAETVVPSVPVGGKNLGGKNRGWAEVAHCEQDWSGWVDRDKGATQSKGTNGTKGMQPDPVTAEQRKKQLTTAFELLEAIDPRVREGDKEALPRWHKHLERASDPTSEASRIAKMVGKLCNQGYNYNAVIGAVTTPTANATSTARPASLLAELMAEKDSTGPVQSASSFPAASASNSLPAPRVESSGGAGLPSASATAVSAPPQRSPAPAHHPAQARPLFDSLQANEHSKEAASSAEAIKKKGKNKIKKEESIGAAQTSTERSESDAAAFLGEDKDEEAPQASSSGEEAPVENELPTEETTGSELATTASAEVLGESGGAPVATEEVVDAKEVVDANSSEKEGQEAATEE